MQRDGFQITVRSFEDEPLHRAIYQPRKHVRKAFLMLGAVARRMCDLRLVKEHDVVFLYEEAMRIGPPIVEWLIHRSGKPIVYDFCDPIYVPYMSPVNKHLSRLKWFSKYARICRLSRHVIVGNPFLAEFARRHNPNTTVIPITIDTDYYRMKDPLPAPADQVTIGWSGSATTLSHLETIRGVLARLSRRRHVKVKIIGTAQPNWPDVPLVFAPWRQQTEISDLQSLDIGIMPLPDDRWTRLRTQLKVRQYMGVGLPVVASPVGIIPQIVQDGVSGFLATTADEWEEKLSILAANPELRCRMGRAGRKIIEDRYSARVWVPKVRDILLSAAGTRYRASGNAGRRLAAQGRAECRC